MTMNEEKNQMFLNHLSKQAFIYDEYNFPFDELYNYFRKNEFPQKLFSVDFHEKEQYYFLIHYFKVDVFYFFNYLINLEL